MGWRTSPTLVQTEPSDWEGFIKVNFYGVMYAVRAALPAMIDAQWGRVVTVISDTARVGETHMAAYSAAKAGAAGFCRSVAREVGRHGITVNCVALGTMNTQGIPPEEDQGSSSCEEVRRPPPRACPATSRRWSPSSRRPRPSGSPARPIRSTAATPSRSDPGQEAPVRSSPMETVDDVRAALAEHDYLADEGLATAIFLALRLAAPAAARGRGRRRQDRGGQGAGPLDRRRARAAPVLRGHRRRARPSTSGTTRASCCTSARSRPAAVEVVEDELYSERFLVRRPLLRGDRVRGRRARACAAGAARRRGRPRRRRVRGVPARDPLRLLDHRARARHVPRRRRRRSSSSRRTARATSTTR